MGGAIGYAQRELEVPAKTFTYRDDSCASAGAQARTANQMAHL
jgi:hypothetical protein